MTNLVQNSKENESQDFIRSQILDQSERIRSKMDNIEEVQSQVQLLNGIIKVHQSKSINKSRKELQYAQNKRPSNANKKIKIYQLQKKLEAKRKEHKQRNFVLTGKVSNYQELMTSIQKINQSIIEERVISNSLGKLEGSLILDISRIEEKCQQTKYLLKNQIDTKRVCQEEKSKRIEEIKRLKKIISQSSQQTEPDDDINFSVDEQEYESSKDLEFSISGGENFCLKSERAYQRKFSDQILADDEVDDQKLMGIRKQKQFKNYEQQYNKHMLKNSNEKLNIKWDPKSFQDLQDQVYKLQEKIDRNNNIFSNLINSTSLIKRGNKNLEASLKHSNMTIQLLKNRVESSEKSIELEVKQLLENIKRGEALYVKLRQKQGERGEIRGNLGIKVENVRLLSIINEQIKLDYQKISIRSPKLKALSLECIQIVQNFFKLKELKG